MKLYGLERKSDLQRLHGKIEKIITKIFDADKDLGILAIKFIKTESMKETLLKKSLSIQKVGTYLYDMNLKIAKRLKDIGKIKKK